jgi:hypothetical protein
MMKIRRLNDHGFKEFSAFIENLRKGVEQNLPKYLLDSKEFSEPVSFDLEADADRVFETRYDLGCYLVELLAHEEIQEYMGDTGFWSWFALLWFEQLCPVKKGKLKPSQAYNYILSERYNHRPRHAIYMTWQLVDRYGENARFMLCKDPSTRGEITEQLMARQEILSSQGAMELASQLYYDPKTENFKKGAAARSSAGCVYRYVSWLQQLQLTFDIFSTSRTELEQLLPKEFDRFRVWFEGADS